MGGTDGDGLQSPLGVVVGRVVKSSAGHEEYGKSRSSIRGWGSMEGAGNSGIKW